MQFLRQGIEPLRKSDDSTVSQLASERPNIDTDYLLGAEPHWSDLLSRRAIDRSDDEVLHQTARRILSGELPNTALV